MAKRRPPHRITVRRRSLYGTRMWWATCTCTWMQGCTHKTDARRLAEQHLARSVPGKVD